MKIADCMSRDVQTVTPDQPIREAAQFMLRADAGSMPVIEDDRLIGMVTDRDIAVRAVAEGRGPDTPVRETMSEQILVCYEDEDIEEVAMKMSDAQVRRFPVLSRDDDGWSALSRSAISAGPSRASRPDRPRRDHRSGRRHTQSTETR
jgi:CBS domain-containing protein